MRLCVGTAKGIVILDPDRGAIPVMVLADPASVWALAQDSADPGLLYAGSMHNHQAGSARGKSAVARSSDGGRTSIDITPGTIRDEDVWAIGTPPDGPGEVFIGTSHARLLHSKDGHSFRECAALPEAAWPRPLDLSAASAYPARTLDNLRSAQPRYDVRRSRRGRGIPLTRPRQELRAPEPKDLPRRSLYRGRYRGFAPPLCHHRTRRLPFERRRGVWTYVRGLSRSYTVPLLVRSGPDAPIYTAAAAGPPPMWSMGAVGADALMFRSEDRGNTFRTIASGDGSTHATRGMVMRIVAAPDNGTLFGVLSDGSVIRVDEHTEEVTPIAEKLPRPTT